MNHGVIGACAWWGGTDFAAAAADPEPTHQPGPTPAPPSAESPGPTPAPPSAESPAPEDDETPDLEDLLASLVAALADGIAAARWPLDAEMHASELLGDLEEELAEVAAEFGEPAVSEVGEPAVSEVGEPTQAEPFDALFALLVHYTAAQRTPEALAVLRTLATFATEDFAVEITAAADEIAASGVPDPVWARTIGRPTFERAWRFGDIHGSQESLHMVFAYGRRRHVLSVLIDHELGGGIKDSYVAEDPDKAWTWIRREASRTPGTVLDEVSWSEARAALLEAVHHEPCPGDLDQADGVTGLAHLLGARLTLPADDDAAPRDAGTAAGHPGTGRAPQPTPKPRQRRPREILQLKVTLKGSKPPIWRRLEVPATITLDKLHEVLQVAFDWGGWHLHCFETADEVYGIPEPELGYRSERGVKLLKVAPVGGKLTYTYDFGDNWEHVILVEKLLPSEAGTSYPRCTGGRRAAPPDDCGGVWGWQELLAALADPTHAEHESSL